MNIYYVYFYLRTDGTPYYIGKGKNNRAYSKNHSIHVPSKDRIIFPLINLTEEQAFSNEKEFIAWYGRKDNNTGILRNLTDGGEGPSGAIRSEETRRKMGGIGHWAKTIEGREFHKQQMIIMNNTPEAKARLSERNMNNNSSRILKNRIKHSASMSLTNQRMLKDGTHPMLKPENKKICSDRMKTTLANQKELTCSYCGLQSKSKGNMIRWHYDKCNSKK